MYRNANHETTSDLLSTDPSPNLQLVGASTSVSLTLSQLWGRLIKNRNWHFSFTKMSQIHSGDCCQYKWFKFNKSLKCPDPAILMMRRQLSCSCSRFDPMRSGTGCGTYNIFVVDVVFQVKVVWPQPYCDLITIATATLARSRHLI